MSLRLTKPGMLAALRHPKTNALIEPLGVLPSGKVVWPVLGAASDDPDDPAYTGEGGEEDDDEDDDEEDESKKSSSKKRATKDDDEDDDEEDDKPTRPERQAARYRTQLREEQRKTADLTTRLKALEDKDKKPDEVVSRDLTEARANVEKLTQTNQGLIAQLAFFKTVVPGVEWADSSDAFALAEREGLFEDVIDASGNVDARELRRGLRDLAKRKPHLVKKVEDDSKARGRKGSDTEDDEDDEEQGSRRSAGTMNGKRKGEKGTPDRVVLARKFPVLNQM
jgi:hypothetical protein